MKKTQSHFASLLFNANKTRSQSDASLQYLVKEKFEQFQNRFLSFKQIDVKLMHTWISY